MSLRLISFLRDAKDFIITFRDVIEFSIPHIYLSALPWLPRTSKVAKLFGPWFPNTIILTVQSLEHRHRQRTLLDLRGHTSYVKSVSLQSDDSRIVSGSLDGTIRVWDAETGEEVMKAFKLSSNASIHSVCFSPDGKHVVSGSSDSQVRVLAVSTGEDIIELFTLEGHCATVTCVAFSPNGNRIVSGSLDTTVRIWDAMTGKEVFSKRLLFGVFSVCFTPSENHIVACAGDNTIRMWDARTGQHIWTRVVYGLTCFSLSPDGEHIIAGSRDAKLLLWNWRVGSAMEQFMGIDNDVHSVGFSPSGCLVVSGSKDGTVRIWNIKTGKEVVEPLKGHAASVVSVYFSWSRIVSSSEDNTIRVWDANIPIGKETEHPITSDISAFRCGDFSPDGTCVLSGSNEETLRVMDSKTGEEVMKRHVSSLSSARFSPDGGSRIVSGSFDGYVMVWDAKTGEEIMTLRHHTPWRVSAILCVGFSSDGSRIFAGYRDYAICVWDANTGHKIVQLLDERLVGSFSSVEFSPDGNFVVSNSMEISPDTNFVIPNSMELNTPRLFESASWLPRTMSPNVSSKGSLPVYVIPLWDVRMPIRFITNATLFATHNYHVDSVCFSPDGSRIISSSRNTIQIWDVSTGREIMTIHDVNMSGVNSICFSPDGTRIVSGSNDGGVRVWDTRSGRTFMKSLEGHTSPVRSLRFSADGSQVMSYSSDKIRVWDMRLAEKVMRMLPDSDANMLYQGNQPLTMPNLCLISPPDKYNGWTTGPNGELIFWVPSEYRSHSMLPPCTLLIGGSKVSFDLTEFVHGVEWTRCWSP